MNLDQQLRIEFEAAKALAEWKYLFAEKVHEEATRIAARSDHPNTVTLSHFRMAAGIALQSLAAAINEEHRPDDQHKSA